MNNMSPERTGHSNGSRRFILFPLLFLATAGPGIGLTGAWRTGVMLGFDAAVLIFLATCAPLLHCASARSMRRHARETDASRSLMLALTLAVMTVIFVTIGAEIKAPGQLSGAVELLVLATLVIAWLFSNIVFAIHYAHLHYRDGAASVDFPGTDEPDYYDFLYFSITLGMTFQTSDVAIRDRRIRRVVIWHCFAAFIFNLGVIAYTINLLGN